MRSVEGPDLTSQKPAQTGVSVPGRSAATRILVLEEHPLLRDGITDFLSAQPDLLVCGEADNIRDARNEIAKCKPQLLLTALRLGTGDSLEFVKALKAEKPGLLILVYSAFEERQKKNYWLRFAKFSAGTFTSAATWRCAHSKKRWNRDQTTVRRLPLWH